MKEFTQSQIRNKQENGDEIDLKKILYLFESSKWLIIGSIIAGGLIALLIASLLTPMYESNGTMLIKQQERTSPLASVLGGNSALGGLVGSSFGIGGGVNMGNEQEVLQSRTLFNAVAAKLLNDPIMSNGRMYPVLWKEWPDDSLIIPQKYIIRKIKKNITYELVPSSSIIRITYNSPSPIEAARMVDLAMQTYQEVSKDQNINLAHTATEFLDSQEAEIRDSLAQAEQHLEHFMDTNDVVSLDSQTSSLIDQYAKLQQQRFEAEAELKGTNAAIEEYSSRLKKLKPGLPQKLANAIGPNIEKLQYKISELTTEKDLIYSNYPNLKPSDPQPKKVNQINSQIAKLQSQIKSETDSLLSSSDEYLGFLGSGDSNPVISTITDYSSKLITLRVKRLQLQAQIDYLSRQLNGQEQFLEKVPENSVGLARLKRNVKVQEELYLAVTKQRAQLSMKANAELGNSRPLDKSVIPDKPSSPNFLLYFLIGMFTAGFLSIGFVLLNSVLSTTFYSIESLKQFGFPVLGVIPRIDAGNDSDKPMVLSRHVDCFDRLATDVLAHRSADTIADTLMVSSASVGDGKTTVCGNLAVALAQLGYRVLTIDADMHHRDLAAFFDLTSEKGFGDVITEKAVLEDVILKSETTSVHVLPAGQNVAGSSALFRGRPFETMMETLKQKYDFILLDTSAVESRHVADLSNVVDEAIITVQFGETKEPELTFALEQLENAGTPVAGIIINKYNAKKATEYRHDAYKVS